MASTIKSPVPPRSADFTTVWAFLEEGIDNIMTRRPIGISPHEYSILYSVSYNFCTSSLPRGTTSSEQSLAGQSPWPAPAAAHMTYNSLARYFVQHVRHLRDYSDSLQNELLLKYYTAEWDRYKKGAKYISHVFDHLNIYIKHMRNQGRKDIYPIYTLTLIQWRTCFIPHIQRKESTLAGAILCLIERQRNGETIDEGPIKKAVDSFVFLGIDDRDLNEASLENYREHFEIPFLVATEAYYKRESESFIAENSVSDYLKKVEERLKEEEDRVERYLHPTTCTPLIIKCEHVLIHGHVVLMWENFQSLLDDDNDEDLQRIHSLLSRIPEGLEPLWAKFEEYVTKTGLVAVSKLVGTDPAGVQSIEPGPYVDALLKVHARSSEIVYRSLKGDAGFTASLDRAYQKLVNRSVGTTLPKRSPDLLANYANVLLSKNNKMVEEGDLEVALNCVMTILEYLEEKEDFKISYWTKLSNRLLRNLSVSDKAEANMISKLKEVCGFEYTIKLQRMLTDMSLSKELTDSFKVHMEQTRNHNDIDINFSVAVLGKYFWPIHPLEDNFILPTDIELTYDRFQRYYQTKHSGRKLTWLWSYSDIELGANYPNQEYIFATSIYQSAVLLQYNNNDRLSLDELATVIHLGKDSDLLQKVLQSLVKSNILTNDDTDQYDFNPHFRPKNIRVNLNQPAQVGLNADSESSGVVKTGDGYPKYVIQASIVRIMKVRKTMKTQPLIQEVISQISQQFTPRIPDIKKAIDALLEKEHIERVDGAPDMLNYVL